MIGTLGFETALRGTIASTRQPGKVLMTDGVLTHLKRPIWVMYEPDEENDWIISAMNGKFALGAELLPDGLLAIQEAMECEFLDLLLAGPQGRTHDADEWLVEMQEYFEPLADNGA